MAAPERMLVLAVGSAVFPSQPFDDRNLSVKFIQSEEAEALFGNARAVILSERQGDIAKIKANFYSVLANAEQRGLAIVVLVNPLDMTSIALIKTEMAQERKIGKTIELFASDKVTEAAEFVRRAFVNPLQRSKPTLDPIKLKDPEMEILLHRAFFDCNRISLKGLLGGKASDGVFIVHAWCDSGNIGTRPLPFFVKFGKPHSIERERQNYRSHAELYVPFNLRPNLDRRRCVRGSAYSALVGNFVEDAISLRQALKDGVGDGVIFSLFETTLKAFRLQAFAGTKIKLKSGLDAFLKQRVAGRNGRQTIEGAEKGQEILDLTATFGPRINAGALATRLYEAAKAIPHWWVPIHGDLHSGNVMVRRGDSILIDFGSVDDGPLTADPATLEVSLVFGTDEDDKPESFDEWKSFVDNAYNCSPRIRPPNPASEPTQFDWLRQSIRELRHILFGCDCHDAEAEIVLAAYLIRFARLEIETLTDPLRELAIKRRAYALVVADRLVTEVDRILLTVKAK